MPKRRKERINDAFLQLVANTYRDNIDNQPTAAVAARFNKAHRTGALYVKQAREAGFLGPARRGQSGEF